MQLVQEDIVQLWMRLHGRFQIGLARLKHPDIGDRLNDRMPLLEKLAACLHKA